MGVKSIVKPVVGSMLDMSSRPLGRRRFRQRYAAAMAAGSVKINFGSGGRPLDGWINCDVVRQGETYLDVTEPWPVTPGTVHHVYADNVIEHLTLDEGRRALTCAFEALAPGGTIRLATPDVEAVARQYLERGELAELGLERHRQRGRVLDHPVQLLTYVYVGAEHYRGFLYDHAALREEMERVGYEVERGHPGTSSHEAYAGLEARLHPAEVATSLVVEGTKPT